MLGSDRTDPVDKQVKRPPDFLIERHQGRLFSFVRCAEVDQQTPLVGLPTSAARAGFSEHYIAQELTHSIIDVYNNWKGLVVRDGLCFAGQRGDPFIEDSKSGFLPQLSDFYFPLYVMAIAELRAVDELIARDVGRERGGSMLRMLDEFAQIENEIHSNPARDFFLADLIVAKVRSAIGLDRALTRLRRIVDSLNQGSLVAANRRLNLAVATLAILVVPAAVLTLWDPPYRASSTFEPLSWAAIAAAIATAVVVWVASSTNITRIGVLVSLLSGSLSALLLNLAIGLSVTASALIGAGLLCIGLSGAWMARIVRQRAKTDQTAQ